MASGISGPLSVACALLSCRMPCVVSASHSAHRPVQHLCARGHRRHTGKLLAHRLQRRGRRSGDQQHRGGKAVIPPALAAHKQPSSLPRAHESSCGACREAGQSGTCKHGAETARRRKAASSHLPPSAPRNQSLRNRLKARKAPAKETPVSVNSAPSVGTLSRIQPQETSSQPSAFLAFRTLPGFDRVNPPQGMPSPVLRWTAFIGQS
jgi:hypothetical protein